MHKILNLRARNKGARGEGEAWVQGLRQRDKKMNKKQLPVGSRVGDAVGAAVGAAVGSAVGC